MRVLLASLLVPFVASFDAVLFSNEQKISSDYPSVENLLSTASADSPLVFFVNPDFTLGQFSQHVNAYSDDKTVSGLASSVKEAKYNGARFLDDGVHAPGAITVTNADDFKAGSAVYIVAGEDWASLDALAQKIIPSLGLKYTGVLVPTEAVSQDHTRVKRVSVKGSSVAALRGEAASTGNKFPMVLPPYNGSTPLTWKEDYGSCLLYSEGINVVIYNKAQSNRPYASAVIRSDGNATWDFNDDDVKCANGSVGWYTFTMRINVANDVTGYVGTDEAFKIAAGTQIILTLNIQGDNLGWWQLKSANGTVAVKKSGNFLPSDIAATNAASKNIDYMGLNSVQGWAWGCYTSQAVFFPVDGQADMMIGISLYNTEIQPQGAVNGTAGAAPTKQIFTLNVDDCTGTFSTGSWMGIISALVLLFGLFFGYLMLQAVKTMDRFDDPKQRQILINVRE